MIRRIAPALVLLASSLPAQQGAVPLYKDSAPKAWSGADVKLVASRF